MWLFKQRHRPAIGMFAYEIRLYLSVMRASQPISHTVFDRMSRACAGGVAAWYTEVYRPPSPVNRMSRQGHQEIDSRKHPEPGRLRVLTEKEMCGGDV